MISLLLFITSIILTGGSSEPACYFPLEFQGEYVSQSTVLENHMVQYSKINVTEDAIPIWGHCYQRLENNVILKDRNEETDCFRCVQVKLLARNILRIHANVNMASCFVNEDKANASCPKPDQFTETNSSITEYILYKTREFNGDQARRAYCPINGKYKLTYNVDDGSEDRMECPEPISELDSCPSGSAINLRLRKCSFDNVDITFECLGHWIGDDNQNYVALQNSKSQDSLGPQYRCAIYNENVNTKVISISFSNDSTCTSISYNKDNNVSIRHTEQLTLYPIASENWPHHSFCTYPSWMLGHWQQMFIEQNMLIFKDYSSFKTYTMKCVESDKNSEKFLTFSRTQCGEEIYHCISIKKRSTNILEFQIGSMNSVNYLSGRYARENTSMELCQNEYFSKSWVTQTRLDHGRVQAACPVNGEFTGMLPDTTGLCANLSSDCSAPDIMHYQVKVCDYDEVIEERVYRCLGQWTENDLVYTYTQRSDIGTYECFVGQMITETKIFISEAGENCQRTINPNKYGMELNKNAICDQNFIRPIHPTHRNNNIDPPSVIRPDFNNHNFNNNNNQSGLPIDFYNNNNKYDNNNNYNNNNNFNDDLGIIDKNINNDLNDNNIDEMPYPTTQTNAPSGGVVITVFNVLHLLFLFIIL